MYEYWFMLFLSVIIATIAMTLGVGGALFFSPTFILLFPLLGVPVLTPADAFGAALITEVFGFMSGLFGYLRKKLIDVRTAISLLSFTIPLAILGTIIKRTISAPNLLNAIFGVGILLLAGYIYLNINKEKHGPPHPDDNSPRRIITDWENNTYEYLVCNQRQGKVLTGIGGFVTGLISVGVGETTVSTLRIRCGLPMKVATGTSVLVVTLTVLSAAVTDVIMVGLESVPYELILFTVPGVLIGGQLGPKLASKLNPKLTEKLLILIFLIFGSIMLLKGIIG